jgi:hypothetical protein
MGPGCRRESGPTYRHSGRHDETDLRQISIDAADDDRVVRAENPKERFR